MARFTRQELEVMRILWEDGELKPAEIQEKFPRPIKNPALRSILSILVEKGHVSRRRVGKAYFYKAKTRRETAFRTTVRQVIDTFCDGSPEALIAGLIRSEKLSKDELLEIKRLADEMGEGADSNTGRKSS